MGEFDKYHLRAQYSFIAEGNSLATMSSVQGQLKAIAREVHHLDTAISQGGNSISVLSKAFNSSASSFGGARNQIVSTGKSVLKTESYLKDIREEFKALSAEAKGFRFNDKALDPKSTERGARVLEEYSRKLNKVQEGISGTSTKERVLTAQIKKQSAAIRDRIELIQAQEAALKAAEDKGFYEAMKGASKQVLDKSTAIGKDFINIYSEFDDQMAAVGAVSRASAEDMDLLRKKSKELGASTRFTSGQAAEAERMLAAAGFRAKDILVGVGDALSLASAGQLDLGASADIASNVLSGLALRVEQLGHVTDVMALAAASANTNIQQLGNAMSYAAPPAKLFGASIEEVSAMVGVMSDSGIQADKAGTALRSVFLRLASPPAKASAALQEYNIAVADASTGKLRNIVDVLEEMGNKFKLDPKSMETFSAFMSDVEAKGGDMEAALENLPEDLHNQAKAIKALNAIFGTTAISGASAAIAGLDKIKWMSLSGAASSVEFEKALSEGLIPATAEFEQAMSNAKLNKSNFFEELVKITPDFKTANKAVLEAVNQITRTDFTMKLDRRKVDELSAYFKNIKEFKDADLNNVKNGGDLFDRLTASTEDAEVALSLMRTGMQEFGIKLPHQRGAAEKMAQVMEDNLAGSFRSLGSALEAVKLSLIEPLAPMIRGIVDAATQLSLAFANLPNPIRAIIAHIGALSVALSGILTLFFTGKFLLAGFAEAQASVSIASRVLKSSLLPLNSLDTFFTQFGGTNPSATLVFKSITDAVKSGWQQKVIPFVQLLDVSLKGLSRTMLAFGMTPLGAVLIAMTAIYFILEAATPQVSLLGKTLGASLGWVAGIAGFIYGFVKEVFTELFRLTGGVGKAVVAPFALLSDAFYVFIREMDVWFKSGEAMGEAFAQALLTPFRVAAAKVLEAWQTLMAIVGGFFSVLVVRAQWVQSQLVQLLNHDTTGTIALAWKNLLGFVFQAWDWLVARARQVQTQLVGLLNHDTTGTIQNAWSSLKDHVFNILGSIASFAGTIGSSIVSALTAPFTAFRNELALVGKATGLANTVSRDDAKFSKTFQANKTLHDSLSPSDIENVKQGKAVALDTKTGAAFGGIELSVFEAFYEQNLKESTEIEKRLAEQRAVSAEAWAEISSQIAGPASFISAAWGSTTKTVQALMTGLVVSAKWVQSWLVQLLNHDTTGTIKNAWTSLKDWISGIFGNLLQQAKTFGQQMLKAIASPFVSAFEGFSNWVIGIFSPITNAIQMVTNAVKAYREAIAPIDTEFKTIANAMGMRLPQVAAPPQLSETQQKQAQIYDSMSSSTRAAVRGGAAVQHDGVSVDANAIAQIDAIRYKQQQYAAESQVMAARNAETVRSARIEMLKQAEGMFNTLMQFGMSAFRFNQGVFFNVGKHLDIFSFTVLSLSSLFLNLHKVVLDSTVEIGKALENFRIGKILKDIDPVATMEKFSSIEQYVVKLFSTETLRNLTKLIPGAIAIAIGSGAFDWIETQVASALSSVSAGLLVVELKLQSLKGFLQKNLGVENVPLLGAMIDQGEETIVFLRGLITYLQDVGTVMKDVSSHMGEFLAWVGNISVINLFGGISIGEITSFFTTLTVMPAFWKGLVGVGKELASIFAPAVLSAFNVVLQAAIALGSSLTYILSMPFMAIMAGLATAISRAEKAAVSAGGNVVAVAKGSFQAVQNLANRYAIPAAMTMLDKISYALDNLGVNVGHLFYQLIGWLRTLGPFGEKIANQLVKYLPPLAQTLMMFVKKKVIGGIRKTLTQEFFTIVGEFAKNFGILLLKNFPVKSFQMFFSSVLAMAKAFKGSIAKLFTQLAPAMDIPKALMNRGKFFQEFIDSKGFANVLKPAITPTTLFKLFSNKGQGELVDELKNVAGARAKRQAEMIQGILKTIPGFSKLAAPLMNATQQFARLSAFASIAAEGIGLFGFGILRMYLLLKPLNEEMLKNIEGFKFFGLELGKYIIAPVLRIARFFHVTLVEAVAQGTVSFVKFSYFSTIAINKIVGVIGSIVNAFLTVIGVTVRVIKFFIFLGMLFTPFKVFGKILPGIVVSLRLMAAALWVVREGLKDIVEFSIEVATAIQARDGKFFTRMIQGSIEAIAQMTISVFRAAGNAVVSSVKWVGRVIWGALNIVAQAVQGVVLAFIVIPVVMGWIAKQIVQFLVNPMQKVRQAIEATEAALNQLFKRFPNLQPYLDSVVSAFSKLWQILTAKSPLQTAISAILVLTKGIDFLNGLADELTSWLTRPTLFFGLDTKGWILVGKIVLGFLGLFIVALTVINVLIAKTLGEGLTNTLKTLLGIGGAIGKAKDGAQGIYKQRQMGLRAVGSEALHGFRQSKVGSKIAGYQKGEEQLRGQQVEINKAMAKLNGELRKLVGSEEKRRTKEMVRIMETGTAAQKEAYQKYFIDEDKTETDFLGRKKWTLNLEGEKLVGSRVAQELKGAGKAGEKGDEFTRDAFSMEGDKNPLLKALQKSGIEKALGGDLDSKQLAAIAATFGEKDNMRLFSDIQETIALTDMSSLTKQEVTNQSVKKAVFQNAVIPALEKLQLFSRKGLDLGPAKSGGLASPLEYAISREVLTNPQAMPPDMLENPLSMDVASRILPRGTERLGSMTAQEIKAIFEALPEDNRGYANGGIADLMAEKQQDLGLDPKYLQDFDLQQVEKSIAAFKVMQALDQIPFSATDLSSEIYSLPVLISELSSLMKLAGEGKAEGITGLTTMLGKLPFEGTSVFTGDPNKPPEIFQKIEEIRKAGTNSGGSGAVLNKEGRAALEALTFDFIKEVAIAQTENFFKGKEFPAEKAFLMPKQKGPDNTAASEIQSFWRSVQNSLKNTADVLADSPITGGYIKKLREKQEQEQRAKRKAIAVQIAKTTGRYDKKGDRANVEDLAIGMGIAADPIPYLIGMIESGAATKKEGSIEEFNLWGPGNAKRIKGAFTALGNSEAGSQRQQVWSRDDEDVLLRLLSTQKKEDFEKSKADGGQLPRIPGFGKLDSAYRGRLGRNKEYSGMNLADALLKLRTDNSAGANVQASLTKSLGDLEQSGGLEKGKSKEILAQSSNLIQQLGLVENSSESSIHSLISGPQGTELRKALIKKGMAGRTDMAGRSYDSLLAHEQEDLLGEQVAKIYQVKERSLAKVLRSWIRSTGVVEDPAIAIEEAQKAYNDNILKLLSDGSFDRLKGGGFKSTVQRVFKSEENLQKQIEEFKKAPKIKEILDKPEASRTEEEKSTLARKGTLWLASQRALPGLDAQGPDNMFGSLLQEMTEKANKKNTEHIQILHELFDTGSLGQNADMGVEVAKLLARWGDMDFAQLLDPGISKKDVVAIRKQRQSMLAQLTGKNELFDIAKELEVDPAAVEAFISGRFATLEGAMPNDSASLLKSLGAEADGMSKFYTTSLLAEQKTISGIVNRTLRNLVTTPIEALGISTLIENQRYKKRTEQRLAAYHASEIAKATKAAEAKAAQEAEIARRRKGLDKAILVAEAKRSKLKESDYDATTWSKIQATSIRSADDLQAYLQKERMSQQALDNIIQTGSDDRRFTEDQLKAFDKAVNQNSAGKVVGKFETSQLDGGMDSLKKRVGIGRADSTTSYAAAILQGKDTRQLDFSKTGDIKDTMDLFDEGKRNSYVSKMSIEAADASAYGKYLYEYIDSIYQVSGKKTAKELSEQEREVFAAVRGGELDLNKSLESQIGFGGVNQGAKATLVEQQKNFINESKYKELLAPHKGSRDSYVKYIETLSEVEKQAAQSELDELESQIKAFEKSGYATLLKQAEQALKGDLKQVFNSGNTIEQIRANLGPDAAKDLADILLAFEESTAKLDGSTISIPSASGHLKELAGVLGLSEKELLSIADIQVSFLEETQISFVLFFRKTSQNIHKFRDHINANHKWLAKIVNPLFNAFDGLAGMFAGISGGIQKIKEKDLLGKIPGVKQFRKASSRHETSNNQSLIGLMDNSGIGGIDALELRMNQAMESFIPSITGDQQNDLFQAMLMGDPMSAIPKVFKKELEGLDEKDQKAKIATLEKHFSDAFAAAVDIGSKDAAALFRKDPKGNIKFNVKPIRSFASFFVEEIVKDSAVAIKHFTLNLPGIKELKTASEELNQVWNNSKALSGHKRLLYLATKSFGVGMNLILRTAISPVTAFTRFADHISKGKFSETMKNVGSDILRGFGAPILNTIAKRVFKFQRSLSYQGEGLRRLFPKTMARIESAIFVQSAGITNYLVKQIKLIEDTKQGSRTGKILEAVGLGAKFLKLDKALGFAVNGLKMAGGVVAGAIASVGGIPGITQSLATHTKTALIAFSSNLAIWGERLRMGILGLPDAIRNFDAEQLVQSIKVGLKNAEAKAYQSLFAFSVNVGHFFSQVKTALAADRFKPSHIPQPEESQIRMRAQSIYHRKLAEGNLAPGTTMDSDAIWSEAIAELRKDMGAVIAQEISTLPVAIQKIIKARNIFGSAIAAISEAGQKIKSAITIGVVAGVAGIVAGFKFAVADPIGAMNAAISASGRAASRVMEAARVGIPRILDQIRRGELPDILPNLQIQARAIALFHKLTAKKEGPSLLSKIEALVNKAIAPLGILGEFKFPSMESILKNDITVEITDRVRGIFEAIQGAVASFGDKVKEKIKATGIGTFLAGIAGIYKGAISFFTNSFKAIRDWSQGSQQRELPPGKQGKISAVAHAASQPLRKFGQTPVKPGEEEKFYMKQQMPPRERNDYARYWSEWGGIPTSAPQGTGYGKQFQPGGDDTIEKTTVPLFERIRYLAQTSVRKSATWIAETLSQSAEKAGGKWGRFATNVGGRFWDLAKVAFRAGQRILSGIADNSPGPSEQAPKKWDNAAGEIGGSMGQMADVAVQAGAKIEAGLTEPVQGLQQADATAAKQVRRGGLFATMLGTSKMGISSIRLMGGGLMGTAAAMGGLSSVFEDTNPEIARMLERFSKLSMVLGAVGAFINTPVLAFLALGGAIFAVYKAFEVNAFGIREKTAAIASFISGAFNIIKTVIVGGLSFIEKILGVFGIRIPFLDSLISFIDNIGVHFQNAIAFITEAWQGFVDKFWGLLYPIVQPAIQIANMLIGALNCNPTERIPEAWEGAMGRISNSFNWLLGPAQSVGTAISGIFSKSAEDAQASSSKGGFFAGLLGFFSRKKEPPVLPVLLDYTKELASAMDMAQKAGDEASLGALKSLQGLMSTEEYASALQGAGGNYLGRAVTVSNRGDKGGLGKSAMSAIMGKGSEAFMEDLKYSDIGLFAQKVGKQFQSMRKDAKVALEGVQVEFGDRFDYLKRFGTTRLSGLFKPGTEILRGQVNLLKESFSHFGKEAFSAIANLDFKRLSTAAREFGENTWFAIGRILEGFKQMSISAIALGIFTLTGLSPVALVMLGLSLAAVAVSINFLGIRTIISGVIKTFIGFGMIATSVFTAVVDSAKAVKRMVLGIKKAFSGDFSEVKAGWQELKSAIIKGAAGVWAGLKQSLGGVGTILQGVFQGVRQILWPIEAGLRGIFGVALMLVPPFDKMFAALKQVHSALSLSREEGRLLGESLAESLIESVKKASAAIAQGIDKVKGWMSILGVEITATWERVKATLTSADFWSPLDPRPAIVRVTESLSTLPAMLSGIFSRMMEGDWSAILDLKNIFGPAIAKLGDEFSKIGDFAKSLLPDFDRIKAALTSWTQPLQGALGILEGFGGKIWSELVPQLEALKGKLTEFGQSASTAVMKWIEDLPAQKDQLVAQFKALGSSAMDSLRQGFLSASTGATNLMAGLTSSLLGGAADFSQVTQEFVANFKELGARAITAIKENFSQMPDAIAVAMETMKASLSPRMLEVIELVRSRFGTLPQVFQEPFDRIKARVVQFASELGDRFTALISKFAPDLQTGLSPLPGIFQNTLADGMEKLLSFGNEFKAKLELFASEGIEGFRMRLANLGPALQSAIAGGDLDLFQKIGTESLSTLKTKFSEIPRLFETLLPSVKESFSGIAEAISSRLKSIDMDAVAPFVERVSGALGTLRTTLSNALLNGLERVLPMSLQNSLADGMQILRESGEEFGTKVIQIAEGAIAGFRKSFDIGAALISAISGGITELAPIIERISTQFMGLGDTPVERILAAWKGLTDRFLPILAPIVEFATRIAQQLISTLNCNPTERIPEAWRSAIERITGMFGSLVQSGVESANKLIAAWTAEAKDFPALSGMFDLMRQISQFSSALKTELLGELSPLIEKFAASVLENSQKMGGAFGGMLKEIAPRITVFVQGIRELREGFQGLPSSSGGAAQAGRKVGKAIATATYAIVELASKTKELGIKILPYLQRFATGSVEAGIAFGKFGASVLSASPDLIGSLLKIVLAFKDILVSVGKFAVEFYNSATTIKNNTLEIIGEISKFSSTMMEATVEVGQGFLRMGGAIAQFKDDAIAAFSGVKSGIGELGGAIGNFVMEGAGAFNKLFTDIGQISERVRTAFKEAFTGLSQGNGMGDVFGGLRAGLGQEIDALKGSFSEFANTFDTISERVSEATRGLRDAFSKVRDVWNNFGSEVGAFGMIASQAFEKAVGAGLEFGAKVAPPIQEIITTVVRLGGGFKEMIEGVASSSVRGVNAFTDLAGAIFKISAATIQLIADINRLGAEAHASLEKLSNMITARAQQDLEKTGAAFKGIANGLKNVMGFGGKGQTETATSEFEAATQQIRSNVDRTADHINQSMKGVVPVAENVGQQTVGALTEASPGPTWQIRRNWDKTSLFIAAGMQENVGDSQKAGNAIAANYGESFAKIEAAAKGSNQIVRTALTQSAKQAVVKSADPKTAKKEIPAAAQAANRMMMSLGGAMSNFAPNLATPLFMVGDFFDLFEAGQDSLQEFAKSGVTVSGVLGKFSSSIGTAATGFGGFVMSVFTGGVSLSGIFAAISVKAGVMWAALSGPLLPLAIAIGALVGMFLIWKFNIFGLGDVFESVFRGIGHFLGEIFRIGYLLINSVFATLGSEIGSVFRAIGQIFSGIVHAFKPVAQFVNWVKWSLFGIGREVRGVGRSSEIVLIGLVLLPLKLVVDILKGIIKFVGDIARSLIYVITPFVQLIVVSTAIVAAFALGVVVVAKLTAFVGILAGVFAAIPAVLGLIGAIGFPVLVGLATAFAPIAAGIALVVGLAFVLRGIFTFLGGVIHGVMSVIFTEIAKVGGVLFAELGGIWNEIVKVGAALWQPFAIVFEAIGMILSAFGVTKSEGSAMGAIVGAAVWAIAIPIKITAGLLIMMLKVVGFIIKAIIFLGRIVITVLISPFTLLANIIKFISGGIKAFIEAIGGILGGVGGFVSGMFNRKKGAESKTPKYATGGWVSGSGTSTSDSIRAQLSRNEFVVNAAAARKYPQILELINDDEFEVGGMALQPVPVPAVPMQYAQSERSQPSSSTVLQPVFNFNFSGDIVLKGASGPESANEFFDSLGPAFNRKVRDILRDLVDKMK